MVDSDKFCELQKFSFMISYHNSRILGQDDGKNLAYGMSCQLFFFYEFRQMHNW